MTLQKRPLSVYVRDIVLMTLWTFFPLIAWLGPSYAVTPKIVDATAEAQANGLYAFSVTVFHEDDGWTHYADSWDVLTVDGQVLGTRTLFHPRNGESTFTRSLSNVQAPIGAREVLIRAHCSTDGYGDTFRVELPPR